MKITKEILEKIIMEALKEQEYEFDLMTPSQKKWINNLFIRLKKQANKFFANQGAGYDKDRFPDAKKIAKNRLIKMADEAMIKQFDPKKVAAIDLNDVSDPRVAHYMDKKDELISFIDNYEPGSSLPLAGKPRRGWNYKCKRVLRRGCAGVPVQRLQTLLAYLGPRYKKILSPSGRLPKDDYEFASKVADGKFGERTERAVRAFQKAAYLTVDGEFGPKTMNALNSAVKVFKKFGVGPPSDQIGRQEKEPGKDVDLTKRRKGKDPDIKDLEAQ